MKQEIFFTVIDFLVMVASLVMLCYEVYRMAVIVVALFVELRLLRNIDPTTRRQEQVRSKLNRIPRWWSPRVTSEKRWARWRCL